MYLMSIQESCIANCPQKTELEFAWGSMDYMSQLSTEILNYIRAIQISKEHKCSLLQRKGQFGQ